ncbi:MAG: DUF262 domain-containing protein [Candidatus Eremiobacteraeota bacterium]|nr:DUF262 domain-containing protein [Candidatus Eremiobacteraeota bacterium]
MLESRKSKRIRIDQDSIKDTSLNKKSNLYFIDEIDTYYFEDSASDFINYIHFDENIVNSDFQRNFVWTERQKSRFIESIILRIPVPPFYLLEDINGELIVIDGLQRIVTLKKFISGEFRLKELEVLPELNGLFFNNLEQRIKNRIIYTRLAAHVIPPDVPDRVKLDIFERLNTGGTKLSRQELRNCVWNGPATRFLNELADNIEFKKVINNRISTRRMKDREYILHFLAFYYQGVDKYRSPMSDFLDKCLKKLNEEKQNIFDELKVAFLNSMQSSRFIFGKDVFTFPEDSNKINISLFEVVSYYMADTQLNELDKKQEEIGKNYNKLLSNKEFTRVIMKNATTRQNVKLRFSLGKKIMEGV